MIKPGHAWNKRSLDYWVCVKCGFKDGARNGDVTTPCLRDQLVQSLARIRMLEAVIADKEVRRI